MSVISDIYHTAKCQPAVRSLGLYATYDGFGPLLYMVDQLLDGHKLDGNMKLTVELAFSITPKQLWGQLNVMAERVRRNFPEYFCVWFGSADAKITPDQFVLAVAQYAREYPGLEKKSVSDYSAYDTMSTEELENVLYMDSVINTCELLTMDEILYVTTLVHERRGEHIDTHAAWEQFRKYYLECGPEDEFD